MDEVSSGWPAGAGAGISGDGTGEAADLARARGGDNAAFSRLAAPLRQELQAHCYRMLGSAHDAASPHFAWGITVLTLRGRYIAEITSFLGADHFRPFRLPASLP